MIKYKKIWRLDIRKFWNWSKPWFLTRHIDIGLMAGWHLVTPVCIISILVYRRPYMKEE